ncbi:MAG: sodium:calcium antiporter [Proteobacteria bacterium]|nr:sodium:calcium antiporter [Pseudomonadota bacterium]MDA0992963.1 sodium:calcium antiporter [Pseudomonadota bacterium]
MADFLLLMCGLAGLWLGSETLIRGAMSIADRYRLSDALFGMLVLAIGTDLPELFVAFDASFRSLAGEDLSGIVIGSAIGSTIGQFALVFGLAGFLGYRPMQRKFLARNTVFLVGSIVAVFVFSLDGVISRTEGILLCVYYGAYLYVLIFRRAEMPDEGENQPDAAIWKAWFVLLVGFGLLLISAELTVASATSFAEAVGLSNIAVSAIIIGMGSSLPELSVSFVALLRKRHGLSVGNLVGSNVLDTLLVPGLAAVISPLIVPVAVLWVDLPVLLVTTVLVLGFLYVSKRGIRTVEAVILVTIYIGYAATRLVGPGS